MTAQDADVIVLGLGTGGEELAGRLALAGLDVVGIEPELVGGECAYWACLPTKTMIRSAKLLQEARRVNGVAGHAEVTPDWAPVATKIREQITGDWDDTAAVQRFEKRGGRFVRGRGTLTGPRTVAVDEQTFSARRGIVISTGSKPVIPPVPGLEETAYWTTRDAIKAEELPGSLIVVGGGTVGCEIGQVFARFGVEVTIIDAGDRLLRSEEPEASEVVRSVFETEGIAVCTGAHVERVEAVGGSVRAVIDSEAQVTADELLVSTGRTGRLDGLELDAAGVSTADGFIQVDAGMQAAEGIWAMGDVTGEALFTHVALHQAPIVEAGILGSGTRPADYTSPPRVTFTDPEVGSVGMLEADARAAGLDVDVTVKEVSATFRGLVHGPGNDGIIKLVADREAGVLVGATSVGPSGGEVLGMLGAAVSARMPIEDLRHMIYAFPTFYGGVGEAVGAYARALTEVLDPGAKTLLEE